MFPRCNLFRYRRIRPAVSYVTKLSRDYALLALIERQY